MSVKRLSKSIISSREAEAVTKILLEDGYLGMGAEVGRFESDIAAYIGVPETNVVCVNTGTSALHLAVASIVTSPKDEILVPSFTFLSSFQAISATGAIPVACEAYADTLTIDLEDAERRITPNTRAIMPVHYASNPGDLNKVYKLAKKHSIRVIEDAAHAFGCSYNGKKIGSFGDIVCFSFDGIKNITSGEGGAIVTSDEEVLSISRDARLLAIEKDSEKRYAGQRSWDFDVKRQGYRYHMSNIFAAIGRIQLTRLDKEFGPKRKALFEHYRNNLKEQKGIRLQQLPLNADVIPHIFPICITDGKRDGLRNLLEKNNVQTGIHYKPNHLLSFYGGGKESLPVTETIYHEIISLPLHPELELTDVDFISSLIISQLS